MTENERLIRNCLRCIVDALDGMADRHASQKTKAKWLRRDVEELDEAYKRLITRLAGDRKA